MYYYFHIFFQNFSNGTEEYYNSSYGMKNISKHIEVIGTLKDGLLDSKFHCFMYM